MTLCPSLRLRRALLWLLLACASFQVACNPDAPKENERPTPVPPQHFDAGADLIQEERLDLDERRDLDEREDSGEREDLVEIEDLVETEDARADQDDAQADMTPPGQVMCQTPGAVEIRAEPGDDLQTKVDQASACDVPLYLSAGTFELSAPIELPGKLTMRGAGVHHTTIKPADSAAFRSAHEGQGLLVVAKRNQDFRGGLILSGFELLGGPVGLSATAGMHWAVIEDVVFHYNDRGLTANGIGNVFRDVSFVNNLLHVDWEGESTHTRFEHCRFTSSRGDLALSDGYALRISHTRQLIFEHCVFELNDNATRGTVLLRAALQVIFRDCWFEYNGRTSADPATSAEVVAEGWDEHSEPALGAKQMVFEGCTFVLPAGEHTRGQLVLARPGAVASAQFRDTHGNVRGALWASGIASAGLSVDGVGDPAQAAPRP